MDVSTGDGPYFRDFDGDAIDEGSVNTMLHVIGPPNVGSGGNPIFLGENLLEDIKLLAFRRDTALSTVADVLCALGMLKGT